MRPAQKESWSPATQPRMAAIMMGQNGNLHEAGETVAALEEAGARLVAALADPLPKIDREVTL